MYAKIIKYLFAIIIMVSSISLVAQQNITDEQGRKQGKWVKLNNGKKVYEGEFIDDKPHGEFLRYYESGRLSSKSNFSEGGSRCYAEFYYDESNKQIKAKGVYIDQKKDSLWMYYNQNGVLVKEENYNMGVVDGVWKVYDFYGSLMKETPYKSGKIDGVQKEYFESGNLMRIMTFENDSLNGEFLVNNPDESIRIKGQFKNGMQDMLWYYYNQDGDIEFVEYYQDGSLMKRTDVYGNPYELPVDADTVDIGKTPEEIMEIR